LNQKGVDFYNQLIDDLIKNKLIPFVTLYHWDLPQHLQDEYKGLLSERFVGDFANYAKLCYQLFGDRVKHWITFNEPYILAVRGSDVGVMAPGRCMLPKLTFFRLRQKNMQRRKFIHRNLPSFT
jgi:beta-glucosidase